MKYRIERNGYGEYRVRYKPWWGPCWLTARDEERGFAIKTFTSYDDAEKWVLEDMEDRKIQKDGWQVMREIDPEVQRSRYLDVYG